jgi:hypothetical protein
MDKIRQNRKDGVDRKGCCIHKTKSTGPILGNIRGELVEGLKKGKKESDKRSPRPKDFYTKIFLARLTRE